MNRADSTVARIVDAAADRILRYGPVKVECTHERVACKDCGATISPGGA